MGLDLTGRNLFEVFPSIVYENSPYIESYRRSMEEGLPSEFEAFYPEPLNVWLRVQSYPTDDGMIIFFRDFTSEKADHEALQNKTLEAERQHSEIEAIYRTAPIGLALFDVEDYRYLRLNDRQAAFFGLKPEQVVGRTVTEMAPIPGLKELFDQVRSGKPVINHLLEGALVTDPSEHRYWTVNYLPVYGPDGNVQAITAASLEITQQHKAEKALIAKRKTRRRRPPRQLHRPRDQQPARIRHQPPLPRPAPDDTRTKPATTSTTAEIELRRVAAITNQTLRFHRRPPARRP